MIDTIGIWYNTNEFSIPNNFQKKYNIYYFNDEKFQAEYLYLRRQLRIKFSFPKLFSDTFYNTINFSDFRHCIEYINSNLIDDWYINEHVANVGFIHLYKDIQITNREGLISNVSNYLGGCKNHSLRFYKGTIYFGSKNQEWTLYDVNKKFHDNYGINLDTSLVRSEVRLRNSRSVRRKFGTNRWSKIKNFPEYIFKEVYNSLIKKFIKSSSMYILSEPLDSKVFNGIKGHYKFNTGKVVVEEYGGIDNYIKSFGINLDRVQRFNLKNNIQKCVNFYLKYNKQLETVDLNHYLLYDDNQLNEIINE